VLTEARPMKIFIFSDF